VSSRSEFPQPVAAHRRGHGGGDVGGCDAERRGAAAIHDDLDFLVAFARFGAHALEPLDRREHARDVVGERGERFRGLAAQLHAEALPTHGTFVVPLVAGLADDDLGQLVLGLLDELRTLDAAFVLGLQDDDGVGMVGVVHRIDAQDSEGVTLGLQVLLDDADRRLHALDGVCSLDVVVEEYLAAGVLGARIDLEEFSGKRARKDQQANREKQDTDDAGSGPAAMLERPAQRAYVALLQTRDPARWIQGRRRVEARGGHRYQCLRDDQRSDHRHADRYRDVREENRQHVLRAEEYGDEHHDAGGGTG
jgi:hypothetical protein